VKTRMRLCLVILLAGLHAGCSSVSGKDLSASSDDAKRTWTSLEHSTVNAAHVSWANAGAPLDKYLLIRDGDFLCAVRFVSYIRGQDARPASFWSSGEETLTAAYEWALLRHNDGTLSIADRGTDKVKFSAPRGFGHLIVGGGYGNVKCGDRKFGWQYPNAINFSQQEGSSMKLAPTRWDRIGDIKLDDAKLIWYSFDRQRKPIAIRLDDLP